MPRTEVRSAQIKDATVGRNDLDTATPGTAVVAKIVAGTGVSISSTGADTGTGDVTISASGGTGAGDVVGPASSVDNSVALYSGITGKLIKDSSQVSVNPSDGYITSPGGIILGTNPALTGLVRLVAGAPAATIASRNPANTQDISLLHHFTDNKIYVGAGVNDAGLILRSAVNIEMQPIGGLFTINNGSQTITNGNLRINSVQPAVYFNETDVPVDHRVWVWFVNNENLLLQCLSDDYGTSVALPIVINRAGLVTMNPALAIGTAVSTQGFLRFAASATILQIASRNPTNTADVALLQHYSDNKIYVGGNTDAGLVLRSAVGIQTTSSLSIGNTPATMGFLRFAADGSQPQITSRNSANTADIRILHHYTDNKIYIGHAGSPGEESGLVLRSQVGVEVQPYLTVNGSSTVNSNLAVGGNLTLSGSQQINSATPTIYLNETDRAANQKLWVIQAENEQVSVVAVTDAVSPISYPLILTRAGDAKIGGNITEKNRNFAMGHWNAVAFSSSNFVGVSPMTWTVSSGAVANNRFTVIGKTMIWSLYLTDTTLGGTAGASVDLTIPAPYTCGYYNPAMPATCSRGGPGSMYLLSGSTIRLYFTSVPALGAGFGLAFTISLEIN